MKRIFAVVLLTFSLGLGGCATFNAAVQKTEQVIGIVTGATVDPAAIIVLANAFDALQVSAKNYTDPRINKRCDGTNGPICRDPVVTIELNKAVLIGRKARNDAKAFLRSHPGQLGPQGVYDALRAAVETIQGVFDKYHINSGVVVP